MAELSPMMQQYLEIKKQHKDEILFYRIGDFYEMFFEDALTASKELDLTVTGKQCGLEERAPMCGVPFHSYEGYVARLIAKGYKVAICEQVEDPAKAKGLVNRVVPADALDAEIERLAQAIIAKSAIALRIGKGMFYRQLEMGLTEAYDYAGEVMACNMMSDDAGEGIDAFMQKRKPDYKGC